MSVFVWAQAVTAPNLSLVILAAAAVGLIVNTIAILAVAWKGGQLVGTATQTMDHLTEEVHQLRLTRDEHSQIIARTVTTMDSLERRVTRLEGP